MSYLVKNVTALWPKIDRPYRFDQGEQRSVACSALEDGAAYEMSFKIAKDDAKELWAYIDTTWKDYLKANGKKPTTMANKPFTEDKEDPTQLIFKAKLKAAYSGQATKPPQVFNAANQLIADADFQLTSGSKVNIALQGIGYMTSMAAGVSLRLRAVQVLELAETAAGASPFEVDEAAVKANLDFMATAKDDKPAKQMIGTTLSDDDFNDDIPF